MSGTLLAVFAITSIGCEDEPPIEEQLRDAYVEAVCVSTFACECETRRWTAYWMCERDVMQRFESSWGRALRNPDAIFDEDCARRRIALYETLGCEPRSNLPEVPERRECDFFSGHKQEGEHCYGYGSLGSDCASGLLCRGPIFGDATCVHPNNLPAKQTEGEVCLTTENCETPLFCTEPETNTMGICEAPQPIGGPCNDHFECAPREKTAWCDRGTCAPLKPLGEHCDEDAQCTGECESWTCQLPVEPPLACSGPEL